ncbi:uncharacterized protein Z518_02899 [Rhinocladiella mackenziei CBS 650.93]|uniref:Rhinocladiella mackenziei CBS 650.93 unplaced genomic scaffold supercont1.2, whole genome shotgun sequence n=1 Tax=Rhinocladiella mackenziei CBS 650.93 TaxID=1442369 RepID=A0A0D2HCP4_9EURO|nr:uncharacterized protein Z518_02899 [Rhinocladiella mackenziei CBS 650.93]KIX08243.1 hypothetical protein Z518_02899 [Rhinocladiella mackenziei CBS 650.93]
MASSPSSPNIHAKTQQGHSQDQNENQTPNTDTDLDQLNVVLDAIRSNLSNVLRTWGRESVQYQSALAIMQSYWAENLDRLKGKAKAEVGAEVYDVKLKKMEMGIEELMRDLRLD